MKIFLLILNLKKKNGSQFYWSDDWFFSYSNWSAGVVGYFPHEQLQMFNQMNCVLFIKIKIVFGTRQLVIL